MNYAKPPLTITDQIALLTKRGMIVTDHDFASHHLQHINYYRLRAYWLPFEQDTRNHTFNPGTRFEDVIDLYTFDRRLRLLLLNATERLEVSFRATWAYALSHFAGAHAHLDLSKFKARQRTVLRSIEKEVARSKETFIEHYRSTYTNPKLPPIWATCEVMTFGQLSKSYSNFKNAKIRRQIAAQYNLPEPVYGSFLHQASYLRNLCAHHNRVWNRDFTVLSKLPRTKPQTVIATIDANIDAQGNVQNRKLYNTLVLVVYLMDVVSPGSNWGQTLLELLTDNSDKTDSMGFPTDWQQRPIWQELVQ